MKKTRSQVNSYIFNSELAKHFPDYQDIMSGAKPLPDILAQTTINIIDEDDEPTDSIQSPLCEKSSPSLAPPPPPSPPPPLSQLERWGNFRPHRRNLEQPAVAPFTFRTLDYSQISNAVKHDDEDPLCDGLFSSAHRREEEREKRCRGTDKEIDERKFRAPLLGLLHGLRGQDWRRVMDISAKVESSATDWEAKRNHYIREIEAEIDKAERWNKMWRQLK